jgi:methylated-DNA-[protein]-cysteine S-methyltransferase
MVRTRKPERWRVDRLAHACVPLLLTLDEDDALVHVSFGARLGPLLRHAQRHGARLEVETRRGTRARRELLQYLAGRRDGFTVELRPLGSTFERTVWTALARVPYATTCSYAELAAAADAPGSARAVGRANGSNPLPIVVPCHRVIGQSGELVGFGGGLSLKRWLLQLERDRKPPPWAPRDREAATQLGLFG